MKLLRVSYFLVFLTALSCQTDSNKSNTMNNIIFKDKNGNTISTADLENVTGEVRYEILGDRPIDLRANQLHQEGRELGAAGKYERAILKLNEAIRIEPEWAYPIYDLAYTYLLMEDFDNAYLYYQKTNQLKPKGFWTVKAALYSLEGERSGIFPKGLYLYYLNIEWAESRDEKIKIARIIVERVPDYAPAWKELAHLLEDSSERLYAIEQGLSKNPDPETKGMLILNKASILDMQGKKDQAIQLLGELIFSPDVSKGSLELAKFSLKRISKK